MDNKTWLGTLAEIKVASHLVEQRHEVFVGWGGKTSCDLICIQDGILKRVQVKGCATCDPSSKSWIIQLRSIRSNRSQNTIKKFDASICDLLAVYIQPEDRVVLFDAAPLNGRNTISIKPLEGQANVAMAPALKADEVKALGSSTLPPSATGVIL